MTIRFVCKRGKLIFPGIRSQYLDREIDTRVDNHVIWRDTGVVMVIYDLERKNGRAAKLEGRQTSR
jgi:hypothetical protein